MSHDVSLVAPNEGPDIDVGRIETTLAALGFERCAPSAWTRPDPHVEAYMSAVDAGGDASEQDASHGAQGTRIGAMDTHTPWETIRSAAGGHGVRWLRLALARELGWIHRDCQTDWVVRPVSGWRFGSPTGAEGAKGTIPMLQYTAQREESSRPKGRIVGKDGNQGYCKGIVADPLGGWACGFSGPTIDHHPRLQFRDRSFALLSETVGVGSALAVHPTRSWLLAGGRLVSGEAGEVCWVDLPSGTVRSRFPLREPFAWVGDATFIAASPKISIGSFDGAFAAGDPLVPGELLTDRWKVIFANPTPRLLRVDLDQDSVTGVHDHLPLKDAYGAGPRHLAVSPEGDRLFVATHNDLCALDTRTGDLRWRRTVGRNDGDSTCFHQIRAIAASSCGRWVAAVGCETDTATSDACVVFDAQSGTCVLALAFKELWRSTPNSVIWHPNGWFAVGTDAGAVAFIDLTGTVRTFKAAPKGVRVLAFTADARQLVLGGTEPQLRVYDLLPDE